MEDRILDAIVFDVGNVLCDWDWKKYLRSFGFDEETYEAVKNATFGNPLWAEHDRGDRSDEEYLQQFIANDPAYEEEIRKVIDRDGDSVEQFAYAKEWVQALKAQGYKLYILSNYSRHTFRLSKDKMEFLPYMDGSIFSYQVQQLKPEPGIYQTLLKRYELSASRCVFLDDRPENVQGAVNAGMKGIVFTGYEEAKAELRTLGVQ